jgi:endonuclease YncB( thermonuclease family)
MTRRSKSLRALLLAVVISILGALGYLRYHSPHHHTPGPLKPAPGVHTATTITGRVVGVADGDTITILDASNQQYKIRLDGIDAPEKGQAFGVKSKLSLSDLVYRRDVTVTAEKTDRYGRTVGMVTVDGRDVGLVQIERGNAWFYSQYASELGSDRAKEYLQAEKRARADRRGLWSDRKPEAPWEWRVEKRRAAR